MHWKAGWLLVGLLALSTSAGAGSPQPPASALALEARAADKEVFDAARRVFSELEITVTEKDKPSYLGGRRGSDHIVSLVPAMDGLQPTGWRTIEIISMWFQRVDKGSTRIRIRADSERRKLDAGVVGAVDQRGREEALERELVGKLEKQLGVEIEETSAAPPSPAVTPVATSTIVRPQASGSSSGVEISGAATIQVSMSFDSAGSPKLARIWMDIQAAAGPKTVELAQETRYLDPSGKEIVLGDMPSNPRVRVVAREIGGKLYAEIVQLLGDEEPEP